MLNEPELWRVARESATEIARRNIKDSDALVSSGLIDSLAVLKLISRLEQGLGIVIPTNRVQPDDFDSVELIVETIKRVAK